MFLLYMKSGKKQILKRKIENHYMENMFQVISVKNPGCHDPENIIFLFQQIRLLNIKPPVNLL